MRRSARMCVAAAASALTALSAPAQPIEDYGFEWVVIGDPGNRAANGVEVPADYWISDFGRVDYRYRIARTEVTAEQYNEFINAYAPYWFGFPNASGLTGLTSYYAGNGEYRVLPGKEGHGATMSMPAACRLCNWLHNNKATEEWAFETGVYDMATATDEDGRIIIEQLIPSPDARYWIPTLNEWTKAMHWDPHKNNGQGGYWLYPHGKDVPPVGGWPEEGAETNAWDFKLGYPYWDTAPVAMYPGVTSPWGLYDGSGGQSEYFYHLSPDHSPLPRIKPSRVTGNGGDIIDRVSTASAWPYNGTSWGVRLASAEVCRADADGDGEVAAEDAVLFLQRYLAHDPRADAFEDGLINGLDIGVFLDQYAHGCD